MPLWHNSLSGLPDELLKLSLSAGYGCPPICTQTVSVRLSDCLQGKIYGQHTPVHQYSVASFGALFAFNPVLLSEPDIVFRLVLLVLLCGSAFFGFRNSTLSLSRLELQHCLKEKQKMPPLKVARFRYRKNAEF